MFTPADRERARDHVLRLAKADPRIVAGAVVGSLAGGEGDRWSDLDLSFGVTEAVPVLEVLEDWTQDLIARLEAISLFDVTSGGFLYRVFLLPGCLQLDLSLAPASRFGARGPRFQLLFGKAETQPYAQEAPSHEMFGHAAHHALRAWVCIERGRYWQAEYWISALRDLALSLACRRRGLPASYGRGFDDLPHDVHRALDAALVTSLEPDELRRAWGVAVEALLRESGDESGDLPDLAAKVGTRLRGLA